MHNVGDQIRVLVVDDDPMVVTGVSTMLQAAGDIAVVATAHSGEDAIVKARSHFPHLILMDLGMPGMGGIEAIRRLQAGLNPPVVVALTSFDTNDHLFQAIEAGAAGYLLKDTSPGDLVTAVRKAYAGEPVISTQSLRRMIDKVAHNPHAERAREAAELMASLTEKEYEVASLVAEGMSNAQIAGDLFLSESTVKTHVNRAMLKLDVTNRVTLAITVERARTFG